MKYLSITLILIIAFTFMGMGNLYQEEVGTKNKSETVETDKKSCDRNKCFQYKCDNKQECKKESCEHKCSKDTEKCDKCGKLESNCMCKKDFKKKDTHKCSKVKCG